MNIFIYEVEIVHVYKQDKLGQGLVRLVSKQLFWLGTPVDSTAVLIPAHPPAFWKAQRQKFEKQAWREERRVGGGKQTLGDCKLCVAA